METGKSQKSLVVSVLGLHFAPDTEDTPSWPLSCLCIHVDWVPLTCSVTVVAWLMGVPVALCSIVTSLVVLCPLNNQCLPSRRVLFSRPAEAGYYLFVYV